MRLLSFIYVLTFIRIHITALHPAAITTER